MHADVRIVSATSLDRQAFRPDLFYRLAELHVCVPPLRQRSGDVSVLFTHFVRVHADEFRKPVRGPSAATLAMLERHANHVPWREIGERIYPLSGLAEALADAEAMRITKALVDPWA